MEVIRLLMVLALRSLLAHRVKSFLVGLLLFVGTFLVVLGSALSRSVEHTMQTAITESIAGHLQVYDADASDSLSLFGTQFNQLDIGEIPRFEQIEASLSKVDNVQTVVPMAVTNATVFGRNDIDVVLTELRRGLTEDDPALVQSMVGRARRIVDAMAADTDTRSVILDAETAGEQNTRLNRATDPSFWAPFEPDQPAEDALLAVDWLDSNIAPLASDGSLFYLQVLATDPQRFEAHFDKFYIVDGKNIEPGQHGFLFSKRTYEQLNKHPIARALDEILDAHDDGRRIADDSLLSLEVSRNAKQYRRITYQLTPAASRALHSDLDAYLSTPSPDLETAIQTFLQVDDSNLRDRHAWFYEHIAPEIRLYDHPVGGTITLRSFTRSGYMRAINVPVVGTYELRGLEEAGLMSATNLSDLGTFRRLYGKMTDADRAELAQIRADVQAVEVDRDDAEAMLFGGGSDLVQTADFEAEPTPVAAEAIEVERQDPDARYDPAQLREGLVLNAALLLEDPDRIRETQAAVQDASDRDGLGLQVVDWQAASGMTGQFILVMRLVLAVALFVIFLVAMIIINNAMVMATMDRVSEIGTLRAIGAQRELVVGLFLIETLVLGLVAGGLGAASASAVVLALGQAGVPGQGDVMLLLFAGPRLYPTIGAFDIGFGMIVVSAVAFASTLYPAFVAARTEPVVAMRGKD